MSILSIQNQWRYFCVIDSPIIFDAVRTDQKTQGNLKYFWNFGDGNTKKGKKVSHIYKHPGNYNIVLNIVSGTKHAVSRTKAAILKSNIRLSIKDEGIEFFNEGFYELNIGNWKIMEFVFPEDTILNPKDAVIFDIGLFNLEKEKVLYFPNGKTAFELI